MGIIGGWSMATPLTRPMEIKESTFSWKIIIHLARLS